MNQFVKNVVKWLVMTPASSRRDVRIQYKLWVAQRNASMYNVSQAEWEVPEVGSVTLHL